MEPLDKQEFFHQNLRHWFEEEKRIFPWRKNPTPYRVWVSEVMLQQTRASVVIPYFERWMARFPTIGALAKAKVEEVIKLWEGLGYYSRARALHEGARYLLARHGGNLPEKPEELAKVKGLGPYTIGAIRSFAFHQKAAAVDGNVLRVMSRLFAIEEEIDRPSVVSNIRKQVKELLPDSEPWVMMEAMIELGAIICTPKPACTKCPLQDICKANAMGKAEELPKKKKPQKVIILNREVLVIEHEKSFLIQKQEGKKVMAGLHEFPYIEENAPSHLPKNLEKYAPLQEVTHTFTRYKAHLKPTIWKSEEKFAIQGHEWIEGKNLKNLPFSSGHRKVLKQLLEDHAYLTH